MLVLKHFERLKEKLKLFRLMRATCLSRMINSPSLCVWKCWNILEIGEQELNIFIVVFSRKERRSSRFLIGVSEEKVEQINTIFMNLENGSLFRALNSFLKM